MSRKSILLSSKEHSISFHGNTEPAVLSSRDFFDERMNDSITLQPLDAFLQTAKSSLASTMPAMSTTPSNHSIAHVVSGSQFRLPQKNAIHCENCDEVDKLFKKSKDTIRSLKLQITRLEDKYSGLRKSITTTSSSGKENSNNMETLITEELKSYNKLLQNKCDTQELELSKLRRDFNVEKQEKERLLNLLDKKLVENSNERETNENRFKNIDLKNKELVSDINKIEKYSNELNNLLNLEKQQNINLSDRLVSSIYFIASFQYSNVICEFK